MVKEYRTKKATGSKGRQFRSKALQYRKAMHLAYDSGLWDAAVSNAVHSLILMANALTARESGEYFADKDHTQAPQYLKEVLGPGASKAKEQMAQVLNMKGLVEYEARGCTQNDASSAVKRVERFLRKGKPREIILAEASAIGCDTMDCLEASGIKKAAEEAGVDRIIDIKSEKNLVEVPIKDPKSAIDKIMLPPFLLDADLIVNLPIFKSHVSMVFTCALKNIKGVVQDMVHAVMHFTDLAAAMMDVWSVLDNVGLTIADMIRPQEGFGPHCGTPVDFGCVVASSDPVALDATACRMVGLDIDRVDYFKAATERGMGNVDESDIEIRGNSLEEVRKPLYLPYLDGFDAWPEYNVYCQNACSTCAGLLAYTLVRLQAFDLYEDNKGVNVVVGRKKELPDGVEPGKELILVGDCLRPLQRKIEKAGGECIFVTGCPPLEPLPYWAIRDRSDQPDMAALADEEIRENARLEVEEENKVFIEWLKNRKRNG